MSSGVKSFVSEKQLDEKRKQRQEEWEKVRNPEDPVEAPEEEYDPRSLYERLQEQKDKKQEEFEEKLKFKNQFRGINEEESDFLREVSKRSLEMEKHQRDEEKKELEEYRNAVAQARELPNPEPTVTDKDSEKDMTNMKKVQIVKKNQQQSILKSAVKRKQQQSTENSTKESSVSEEKKAKQDVLPIPKGTIILPSATKCVGVLPGLGAYSNSDDSDNDSSSDESEVTDNLLSKIIS